MLPPGIDLPPAGVLARMVTSFATTAAEVDQFADLVQKR
jgi:threonine aldolase